MPAALLEVPQRQPVRGGARALGFARLLGAAALLGLASALWLYASYNGGALLAHRPPLISFGDALGTGLMDWCLWLPLWPVLRAVAARFPWRRGAWRRALLAHALVAPVCSLVQLALFALASVALRAWLYEHGDGWTLAARVQAGLAEAFAAKFKSGVLVAALALLALQAFEAWKRARASELSAEQLARALAEARLAALSAALEPHFLFNA
ncbi:MAG: hypothetical protein EXS08_13180, partial [Planctomycetes bacterium]|nr:hypothetical protein [Planctomycetota bacterium]